MRFGLLLVFLLTLTGSAYAQTYYVAIVKGKITRDGQLLKKRDKLKLGQKLRFSSKDDYVKVSGPGGIYKIEPSPTTNGSGEFFIALREELFPKVRYRGSYSATFSTSDDVPALLFRYHLSQSILAGTSFELDDRFLPFSEQLRVVFLDQNKQELIDLPLPMEQGKVVFREGMFTEYSPAPAYRNEKNYFGPAYLVGVPDLAAWAEQVAQTDSLHQLDLDHKSASWSGFYNWAVGSGTNPDSLSNGFTPYLIDLLQDRPVVLDLFPINVKIVDPKVLNKDLKQQIKASRPESSSEFLEKMFFDEYISEVYGDIHPYQEMEVMINKWIEKYRRK